MEGTSPSRRGVMKSRRSRSFSGLLGGYPGMPAGARERLGEAEDEEGEESVKQEHCGETEVANALEDAPEIPQDSNLAPTNQPLVSQSDPILLKIMEKMANIMGHLSQAAAPRDNSKAPKFKNPSMKAPDPFDGTQAHKLGRFIQSCKLIFLNDSENFCTQLLFSQVELENGLNPTFQIFPKKILPTSSIIGSFLKPIYSLCLVI
ncbi:hypothetical protein O181_085937 [Austropuccinia psidii MF-1]|uniref:Uncharacterized protein n=1 Tax=Austropuccinia psidii MF-1 TaxID=1389203 RepID=A0A9Q3IM32_9BASI|nr:hypothetical protein [Austropuccinia psidii MF-1]